MTLKYTDPAFIVVARADGDVWSYGPFADRLDAVQFEQRAAEEYPDIDYETTQLIGPQVYLADMVR